jgi:hypothetical protein
MSDETLTMRVCYANGEELVLECPLSGDDATIATRMQEALQRNQLLIETGEQLLVIPLVAVTRIEVTPAPDKLPRDTIRNARRVTG